MSPEQVQSAFRDWRAAGWIRPLDEQFVHFLARLDESAEGHVLLLAGLASHVLGLGHVSLECARLHVDGGTWLALPPERAGFDVDPLLDERARESWQAMLAGLNASGAIDALDRSVLVSDGEGSSPLVWVGGRLYLRRNWQAVVDIRSILDQRSQPVATVPQGRGVRVLIDALFPQDSDEGEPDWQKIACAVAVRSRFTIITGGPGTGKTWTMVKLLGLLHGLHRETATSDERPLRVLLAAPTGKAAARMTESVMDNWSQLPEHFRDEQHRPPAARTLHRLLGSRLGSRHFRHHAGNPIHADVVIVDEASMIDLHMMHSLLAALAPRTRLVLLGDKDQLASVEPGSVFGDLCEGAEQADYSAELVDWLQAVSGERLEAGTGQGGLSDQRVMLRRTRRFNQDIAALAQAVNAGQADVAARLLDERAPVLDWLRPGSESDKDLRKLVVDEGYAGYLTAVGAPDVPSRSMTSATTEELDSWISDCLEAYTSFQVLTATRSGPWGVEGLNRRIRQWLVDEGLVEAAGQWFHGRPVMITRNDYRSGLMNGDVGLCLALPQPDGPSRLRVVFRKAGGELHQYSPARIPDCQTAWAMTVHKSQGSEFGHTVLVLPDHYNRALTRELIYTGLTRARERFTLVAPSAQVFSRAVEQRTDRSSTHVGR